MSSWGFFAAIALCAILHITIRDDVPVLAILFYATPPRLLLVAGVISAVAAVGLRRWRVVGAILVLVCVVLAPVVASPSPEFDDGGEGHSIVLLNASGGDAGIERIVGHVVEDDPDLVVLVEAGMRSYREAALEHGYTTRRLAGRVVVLTRDELRSRGGARAAGYARGHAVRFADFDVLIIDVVANPLRSRHRALDAISAWSVAHDADLILGDFNTPLTSRAFDRLKQHYVAGSPTEVARESWPLPFPVLDLDHVFGRSDRVRFTAYSIDSNDVSDHCTIRVRVVRL